MLRLPPGQPLRLMQNEQSVKCRRALCPSATQFSQPRIRSASALGEPLQDDDRNLARRPLLVFAELRVLLRLKRVEIVTLLVFSD